VNHATGEQFDLDFGPWAYSVREFDIIPNKPLETPDSFSSLPVPTPGQANLSDATPRKDAVAALGGRPALLDQQGVGCARGFRFGCQRIALWHNAEHSSGHGGRGRFVPQAARTVFKHSSVQNGSLRQRLQT